MSEDQRSTKVDRSSAGEYKKTVLGNGIRVVTDRLPDVRSVSLGLWVGTGSSHEDAAERGISHCIEHMLFKGTRAYPTARLISEAIEGVGGVLDAETGKELTVYSTKTAMEHLDLSLGLLADMVRHPVMDPDELEKERRVIVDELAMYRDSPQEWVGVLGEEAFWPGLPLGREVAGTRETVESIQLAALLDYRTSHYVPGNLVVSVVGNIEHDDLVARVARLLGDWEPREAPAYLPCPPPRDVPRLRLVTQPPGLGFRGQPAHVEEPEVDVVGGHALMHRLHAVVVARPRGPHLHGAPIGEQRVHRHCLGMNRGPAAMGISSTG